MGIERSVIATFSYGHIIPKHPLCGYIHGHNAKIKVDFAFKDETQFVDFHNLKDAVEEAIEPLDHNFISYSEIIPANTGDSYIDGRLIRLELPKPLYTAEDISQYLLTEILEAYEGNYNEAALDSITITFWETEKYSVTKTLKVDASD